MPALFVVQVATSIGCIVSIGINWRAWRRWNAAAAGVAPDLMRATTAVAMAQAIAYGVIDRCHPYLSCDQCGATISHADGCAVTPSDPLTGHPSGIRIVCGPCAPARPIHDDDL